MPEQSRPTRSSPRGKRRVRYDQRGYSMRQKPVFSTPPFPTVAWYDQGRREAPISPDPAFVVLKYARYAPKISSQREMFCSTGIMTRRCTTNKRMSIPPTTFAQVIHQARLHDEEALVALYTRALPVIYRYVLARLDRADLAEDVVSEVFLVMVESIGDLRTEEEAGFYALLIQIAQGKVSRALQRPARDRERRVPLPGTHATDQYAMVELMATDLVSDPVALHEWRETLEEVGLALGSLSAEQQVIVIGRFLAGLKIEDLAKALGKQPGAVRVSQYRALRALAEHLGRPRGPGRKGKGERP